MEYEYLTSGIQQVSNVFNKAFFKIGDFQISLFTILHIAFLFFLLYFVSSRIRQILHRRLTQFQSTKTETVLSLLHYSILTIGSLVILQSAGMDLSALAVLAGAIGIGLGFGLQNVTNNFISGLIILFERPIKVGDRVEVGQVMGQVIRIGLRSTTVLTNDNISIIIPNADFVSGNVINWSHTDDVVRIRIPIGVSYNSDPKKVVKILESTIKTLPGVLENRGSDVILDSFGDNAINFVIRVWTQDFSKKPGLMKHQVNMAVWEALKLEGIEIPFPQLDLHIRSRIEGSSTT